jgi:excisionase family DNA binding protein
MLEARVTIKVSAEAQAQVLADLDGRLFASVPETAVVLRSDQRTVRRSIEAGDIPATAVGRVWRVPVSWLRKAAGLETAEAGH